MSCLIWNCQGLGVPLTIHTLGDILRKYNPDLVFLSETRSTRQTIERLKRRWNLFGIAVEKNGRSGGLALLWRREVTVTLSSYSHNHVDVEVLSKDGVDRWRFTGFYGFPEKNQRHKSWELMCDLRHQSELPWVVGGDFNEILSNSEKIGGNARSPSQIEAFRIALESCNLSDIGFRGTPFTWSNNREHPLTVRCRLDRFCADTRWLNRFPHAHVQHLEFPGSDHIPIMLRFETSPSRHNCRGRKPFRFESMWIRRDDCEAIINQQWTDNSGSNPIEAVLRKNDGCRLALMEWSKNTVRSPQHRIEEIQKRVHALHIGTQSESSRAETLSLRTELERLYVEYEMYWRQRSRVQWMREGDRNTKFFHAKATIRHRTNRVDKIQDNSGVWKDRVEDIEQVVSNYFREIFRTNEPNEEEIDEVMSHIEPRISYDARQVLSQPFTAVEVNRAIGQMAPLKSPGPDGLPVLFYTKYWHILGADVTSCVLEFLNKHTIPSVLNFTYIVLIPKVKTPEKITDYRPISLCNVIYKFGSKVIFNRLKLVLNNLISSTQSAFVPKQLITDNVLVAFEINHFIKLNSNNWKNYMAIKLDISKAYDRIKWIFLKKILVQFGLPLSFIELIMLCISSVSYAFLFNGIQFGSVQPSRGLRQGDPLSPYLFICCTEALIAMVNTAVENGELHGVRVAPTAPPISNLCFADDTLFFCEASELEACTLKGILEKYARMSGQVINLDKSTMVFSPSTPNGVKESIHSRLGFKVVDRHDKYLGMPCSMGRTKKEIFGYLRDRIWTRIKGWGEKQLSRAGKEVLIKSVLQSIPTYIMSCFLLPSGLLKEIELAIRRYWWGNGKSKGMAWISWRKLCSPKTEGGIGFREMKCFNLALLAKQGWRITTEPNLLLTRVLKAKYFPNTDFFSACIGSRPSATWRSILGARNCLKLGTRMRIGDGKSTSLWADQWLVDDDCLRVITKRPFHTSFPNTVADIIEPVSHNWNIPLINSIFWPIDRERILSVPIGGHQVNDKVIWHFTPHGRFSVNSCYRLIFARLEEVGGNHDQAGQASSGGESGLWRTIWKMNIPPKIRIFIWRAALNSLPTASELYKRKVSASPLCHLCGKVETILHVFTECRGMDVVWQQPPFAGVNMGPALNFVAWFEDLNLKLQKEQIWLAAAVMWKAWDTRNRDMHGENNGATGDILTWSTMHLTLYHEANTKQRANQSSSHPASWLPPGQGTIKINIDAAFPVGRNFYTTSMVARDWMGNCIWWCVEKFPGRPKPIFGEARAALQALRKARESGWRSVIVEGDCLQIIEALQGGDTSSAPFGAIIEGCLTLARNLDFVSFVFVKRAGNKLANAIAKSHDFSCTEGFILPSSLAPYT